MVIKYVWSVTLLSAWKRTRMYLPFINNWRTYLVERAEVLKKNIKLLESFPVTE